MAISFDGIPNTRVPFVYAEFSAENAQQGLDQIPYKGLMIGQLTSAGSKPALTEAVRLTSAAQATDYFGAGSQLARMAAAWFANNTTTELHAIALADGGAWAAASGTVTVSSAPSASGTLNLYIAGQKVEVGVNSADEDSDVAASITAAINAATYLPVTATQGTTTSDHIVTLAAKNKGLEGNDLDVRHSFADGEALPAGLGLTIVQPTGGTGSPDLTTAFALVEDEQYQIITMPYRDADSLAAMDTELESRWGPLRQQEGLCFIATDAGHSDALTFGDNLNSKHLSVMSSYGSPTSPAEWAAGVAAVIAFYGNIDPARPFQTLPLNGVRTPPKAVRFTSAERNLLLQDGISTTRVDSGGKVLLERVITTYQENGFGAPDIAYLDVNTPLTLGYLRASFRNRILRKFPRHKLADDGTQYGAGQAIVTPKVAKAECIAIFREWETAGLVEGIDQFKEQLIVERNASDPNRLDFLLPPDLVNQLRMSAVKIAFLL